MHHRRRIVFLFGLGIVLPSLLLSYLAFRGIQNDRALVEKERLEGTRRAADQVVRKVDEEMTAIEGALSRIVADRRQRPAADFQSALEKFSAGNALVEQVFDFPGATKIRFPAANLSYLKDGAREAGSVLPGDPRDSAAFQAAQRLEFQSTEFPQALAAYRRALEGTDEPRLKGMVLNAIARVQKKSGQLREAISTYELVGKAYGNVVFPGGMPLGPSAALEICVLSRAFGDFAKSLQASFGLYRSLLQRDWILERAEFEFFVRRAKDEIEILLSSPQPGLDVQALRTEFLALESEDADSRNRTERAIVFQESAASTLEAKMGTGGGPAASGPLFNRLIIEIGNATYLVSIERPAAGGTDEPDESWGMIIDGERLREGVLRPALLDDFPPGQMAWTVTARDGSIILSSDAPSAAPLTFRTNFASNFPDWSLEFRQPPPRLIRTFLLSRRGLYFFVFLLIAGILGFGLFLTLRSVSHELELARMKSDFVSTVSHEFKSPLTSIRQLAEMLQSGRVPSEERRQKYYDVLLEQSDRLALLTDNILSLAKIEEGRAEFKFEKTDISALLAGVVGSIRERVRHEGFDIGLEVIGPLPLLSVDRTALSQAVTNLVDNAIKYSGDSRKISVTARLEEETVAIAVRDHGVGIKEEDVPRLFERFYRGGDELTRAVKGSGLGLTLVKEIVAAHRGTVRVETELGKGSVFTIRLPLPRQVGC